MATLYTHADKNVRKTWLLFAVFLVFIIGLGYIFSYNLEKPLILYIAVAFSSIISFVSYWFSDKIALAVSRAHEVKHEENPELFHIVENLCITAGLPMPRIYIIDEPAINAFATGRDKEHAVVALTRGAIEKLNKNEIEGVVAHELSHIGNRDILLATVIVILVGFISLMSHWFLRFSFLGGGRRSRQGGQIGQILALVGLILAILSPLATTLIQLAISRKREFLADADGALLTRYPEGLASALEKIALDTNQLTVANNATAHLFIANPFKKKNFSTLFMSHPPIEERVRILRGMS
ncbi:MAG: zinc metalloprotease HtpX [Candidatus Portnoybacteria bacterium RBG_19FT_COMBO_36_7]|uniref:Protease HtpX homolog n=1 Tax=Candidatus Portnoybacteria bacterium RBG_19FT_COMBO_36_7 TaxID=1801992 RepID=A0A1G2F8J7_9BACT|nr:MAG: zinc metalloprotease HtpX [Candidatus Portnoybacteria bacterium RBG_19FT_COMBO_36_7]